MTSQTNYTASEAAKLLSVDTSRILQLCREGRLGQTMPKHGRSYVITAAEIAAYQQAGPHKRGPRDKQ